MARATPPKPVPIRIGRARFLVRLLGLILAAFLILAGYRYLDHILTFRNLLRVLNWAFVLALLGAALLFLLAAWRGRRERPFRRGGRAGLGLIVEIGGRPAQRMAIDRPVITLGQAGDRHIVLTGERIAPHHCRVIGRRSHAEILDEQSAYGTYINGRHLGPEVGALVGGEVITLGGPPERVDHRITVVGAG